MDSRSSFISDIRTYAEKMKLGVIKSDVEQAIADANANNLSYEEFLYVLLQKEYDIRAYNLTQSRIRTASFPYKKYLEDLSIKDLPADAQIKLKYLSSLKFIKDGQNVILSGNCGTRKTHIAIA